MVRRKAVSSATRALRCLKHEVGVVESLVSCLSVSAAFGPWCAINKAVLERYAALRCLWHG
eukprot:1232027-Prymnesium_polylepis.1